MRAEDVVRRLGEGFDTRVDKLGSWSQAATAIGHGANFYTYQLKTPGGVSLSYPKALLSLEKMGDLMPEEVIHTAVAQLDADPALILLAAREYQELAADLYFREARPRLEALIDAGPTAEGDWSNRAAKIKKLEKLRRTDRELAKQKLQVLISHALDRLEATGLRPRQAFADLAAALCILAALQRLAGRRDDAMDLLLAARQLCVLARDPKARGDWYQTAAYLLVDLSRETRAYQFLQEANTLYFLAGLPAKQAEVMVDFAYVLNHAGCYAESREVLELALPLLPESDLISRTAAYQILADNLQELGDLAGAQQQLDRAIELLGDDLFSRAYCLWSRARLLAALGDVQPAAEAFRQALPLYAKLTGAGELAELAMEYAALLAKEKRRPELRALAADLSGWIRLLRGNRKLREVIENFAALVEMDKLDAEALVEILTAIADSKPPYSGRL